MLCGDISQVPAEVNASVYAFQTLLAMPVMVWIGLQMRTLYRDIKVNDFDGCEAEKLAKVVLKQCPKFQLVREHAIELFGVCKKCAA